MMLSSVLVCAISVWCVGVANAGVADPPPVTLDSINADMNSILIEVANYLAGLKPSALLHQSDMTPFQTALEASNTAAIRDNLKDIRRQAKDLDYTTTEDQLEDVKDELRSLPNRIAKRIEDITSHTTEIDEFVEKLDLYWAQITAAIVDERPEECYLEVENPQPDIYSNGEFCIKVGTTARSVPAARADCEANGMEIATVDSQAKHDYIASIVRTYPVDHQGRHTYWIGGIRNPDNSFSWYANGQPFSATGFSAWHSGEPNDSGGIEDCVHIWWQGDSWNDSICSMARKYVCTA